MKLTVQLSFDLRYPHRLLTTAVRGAVPTRSTRSPSTATVTVPSLATP